MDSEYPFQTFSQKQKLNSPQPLLPTYSEGNEPSEEEKFDIAWLFAVVRRRLPIMILVAIVLSILTGAAIVKKSRQVIPEYEGQFKLLVEPITAEGRLARQYIMAQSPDTGGDLQRARIEETSLVDYQTLIRVLRSPKLLEPVVDQLQTQYPKMRYGTLVSRLQMTRITVGKGANEKGTKILVISYQDVDPNRIEAVLDHLVDAYLAYSVKERMTSLRQGIQFIDKNLPELRQKVDTLQTELQRLRQNYNVMNPELADRVLSEHLLIIQRQRLEVQAQLAQTQALSENLEQFMREGNTIAILSREAKAYETLMAQIQKLESELAVESALFREDSSPIQSRRDKLENLYSLANKEALGILKQVRSQWEELKAREQSLEQSETMLNRELRQLPEAARVYMDLQRELEVATNTLKDFLSKREALRVDVARQEVPWELIDPPKVPQDSSGRAIPITVTQTARQLAVAVIISMLVGIGAGFLVEVLHTVFHTPEEVKTATKLPLLGVIPFAKEFKKRAKAPKKLSPIMALASQNSNRETLLASRPTSESGYGNASPILEAFRSLHTNIRLLRSERPIHSLVIGSVSSGDGKSTVALNLAETAAAIGQRVLLVDADLRYPKVHTKLDLPNLRGLSDTIMTDLSLNEAIQRSPTEENLFVLTAGSLPSDPIKLLSSRKMQCLMEQFQDFFDLVIYDSPPLFGLADASILASQTDGLILLVGLAKTDRTMVKQVLDGLSIAGSPVLGVVANGIKGYMPRSIS